jgi:cyclic pyranopterin phosphate synthase
MQFCSAFEKNSPRTLWITWLTRFGERGGVVQSLDQELHSFTHLDNSGAATMVDVGEKPVSKRMAIARATLFTRPDVIEMIKNAAIKKGDVLAVARVAGIMAAKKTSELIPLCHPLSLSQVTIDFEYEVSSGAVFIHSCCRNSGQTGVEMEALTVASVAALTIYDMCKSVDMNMEIQNVYLEQKSGGKHGHWKKETLDD